MSAQIEVKENAENDKNNNKNAEKAENTKNEIKNSRPNSGPDGWVLKEGDLSKLYDENTPNAVVVFERESIKVKTHSDQDTPVDSKTKQEQPKVEENIAGEFTQKHLYDTQLQAKTKLCRVAFIKAKSPQPIFFIFFLFGDESIKNSADKKLTQELFLCDSYHTPSITTMSELGYIWTYIASFNDRSPRNSVLHGLGLDNYLFKPGEILTPWMLSHNTLKLQEFSLNETFEYYVKIKMLSEKEALHFQSMCLFEAMPAKEVAVRQKIKEALDKENYEKSVEIARKFYESCIISGIENAKKEHTTGFFNPSILVQSRIAIELGEALEEALSPENAVAAFEIITKPFKPSDIESANILSPFKTYAAEKILMIQESQLQLAIPHTGNETEETRNQREKLIIDQFKAFEDNWKVSEGKDLFKRACMYLDYHMGASIGGINNSLLQQSRIVLEKRGLYEDLEPTGTYLSIILPMANEIYRLRQLAKEMGHKDTNTNLSNNGSKENATQVQAQAQAKTPKQFPASSSQPNVLFSIQANSQKSNHISQGSLDSDDEELAENHKKSKALNINSRH